MPSFDSIALALGASTRPPSRQSLHYGSAAHTGRGDDGYGGGGGAGASMSYNGHDHAQRGHGHKRQRTFSQQDLAIAAAAADAAAAFPQQPPGGDGGRGRGGYNGAGSRGPAAAPGGLHPQHRQPQQLPARGGPSPANSLDVGGGGINGGHNSTNSGSFTNLGSLHNLSSISLCSLGDQYEQDGGGQTDYGNGYSL